MYNCIYVREVSRGVSGRSVFAQLAPAGPRVYLSVQLGLYIRMVCICACRKGMRNEKANDLLTGIECLSLQPRQTIRYDDFLFLDKITSSWVE